MSFDIIHNYSKFEEVTSVNELVPIKKKIAAYYSKGVVNIQKKIRRKCEGNKIELEIIEIKKEIERLCAEYVVVDWTDEDSCCCEFHILLHENQKILDDDIELITLLGGKREDLRLFLSVLDRSYYMFIERTEYNAVDDKWNFYTLNKFSKRQEKLIKKINDYLETKNWIQVMDKDAKSRILDIETELKYAGQATVFSCLFTEKVEI